MGSEFGGRLRGWREAAELTQEELGRWMGVTGAGISALELGRVLPSEGLLVRLGGVGLLDGVPSLEVLNLMVGRLPRPATEAEAVQILKVLDGEKMG